MDTIPLLIQIPPREIAYLTFVLESYEGVAAIRTVDPREGIVELMVPTTYQEEIREILKDLAEEFPVKAGDVLFIPANERHTIMNRSNNDLRYLEFYSPIERDFIEVAE